MASEYDSKTEGRDPDTDLNTLDAETMEQMHLIPEWVS